MGAGVTVSVKNDNKWVMENKDFSIELTWDIRSTQCAYLTVVSRSENFSLAKFNESVVNIPDSFKENRIIKWEDTDLNGELPKLIDAVSNTEYDNMDYKVFVSKMREDELSSIIGKIMNSFEGEYKLEADLSYDKYRWNFSGNVNGKPKTIAFYYETKYSLEYLDCAQFAIIV